MNRSERTYSQLVALLRDTPPATSFTPEEILSLTEQPAGKPAPEAARLTRTPMLRRIAIVAGLLGVSIVGVWLLPLAAPDRASTSPPASAHQATSPASENGTPHTSQPSPSPISSLPADGTSAVVGNHGGTASATHQTSTAVQPAPPTRQTPALPLVSRPNDSATATAAPDRQEPPLLTMLELSPEELKSLGVVIINGEIQTFAEEYYTLTTEQDRALFARMGIDTTRRTGIVRMRLSIDTFGLTTRKHGWARVENFSRVAPIIALNSYVKDGRRNAVTLNSFSRSPIMNSSKRSADSMVGVLAKVLMSDFDRVIHDSSQTSPARVLVPVHIRLGDSPIGGGAKRRGADVILWYYPTPEFAAALPARYRVSLQTELNAIADVVECNLPPSEACRMMTGEPLLLNYCRRSSGALRGLGVSPNPGNGAATVRYMLGSPRTITAELYGIRGEYIRELVPAVAVGAGAHTASVQLGSVSPGAYMIVLRSEQGEQMSERLIVQ